MPRQEQINYRTDTDNALPTKMGVARAEKCLNILSISNFFSGHPNHFIFQHIVFKRIRAGSLYFTCYS